ncbi:PREDICTED: uncharacterized protein LOC106117172 [Papilio xuthus]|uniref:Uncharacterized protein LOC106117172 n=1 Tax=Papilio xuthus TaxID=66420 RepID=A0AAJ6Z7L6_PAPXU|nr:PREDICTED: uncharacterized protein LOC106117172 [Papilio xuthus]
MRTSPVWIFAMLLQLQTEGIKGAVPIEVVAQKVVPLKWARAPAIIPMIPDKEPIIPPSRRAGNADTAVVLERGVGTKQHYSDWTGHRQELRSRRFPVEAVRVLP